MSFETQCYLVDCQFLEITVYRQFCVQQFALLTVRFPFYYYVLNFLE